MENPEQCRLRGGVKMVLEIPIVWTVEFKDRTVVSITHADKEQARILAKAQRIKDGKSCEIRCMYKRVWV